jgi:hypothetical protein
MNCGVNASLLLNALFLLLVLENPPTIEDEDENDDDQCY